MVVPNTPVFLANQAAIDRFLGLEPRSLAGVAVVRSEDVPNRWAPLLAKLDVVFAKAPVRAKRREVLVEERWFQRSYPTVAYRFGSASAARRQNKEALLVTAGIHGDEAGGVLGAAAILEAVAAGELLDRFEPIVIVPCVHPAALDLGVRELFDGRDPNRLFFTDDASRPATVRALETLASELFGEADGVLLDLHQDDRFDADACYALFGNARSRAYAQAAAAAGGCAVTAPIDEVDNDGGALEKRYPGAFALPPSARTTAVEVTLECNDPNGFLPALRALAGLTRSSSR